MKYEPPPKRRYIPVWHTVFILSEFVAVVQQRVLESLKCSFQEREKGEDRGRKLRGGRIIERHLGITYGILLIIQVHLLWNTVGPGGNDT